MAEIIGDSMSTPVTTDSPDEVSEPIRSVAALATADVKPSGPAPAPPRSAMSRPLVPVPDGYRLVGWIRPHEAAAVVQAHQLRRDVPVRDDQERVVGWARYHPDHSEAAITYRSNVEVQRTTAANGARIVAWLKRREAEALVLAAQEERDLQLPAGEGHGAMVVQYFPPQSSEALAYRSVTRLLRGSR